MAFNVGMIGKALGAMGKSGGEEGAVGAMPIPERVSLPVQNTRQQFVDILRQGNPRLSEGAAGILADQQIRMAIRAGRRIREQAARREEMASKIGTA